MLQAKPEKVLLTWPSSLLHMGLVRHALKAESRWSGRPWQVTMAVNSSFFQAGQLVPALKAERKCSARPQQLPMALSSSLPGRKVVRKTLVCYHSLAQLSALVQAAAESHWAERRWSERPK